MTEQRVGAVLVALGLAALGASACSTTRAATPVERPALEVPPPPPRVITPLPPPPTPSPEPVPDLPPESNGRTAKPSRPPQKDTKQAEPPKPVEPKPEVPPETAPPAAPQQPLRLPETADPAQMEKQIRAGIANSRAILARTDFGRLNDAQKKAYQNSQLFAQQAEEAIKASNLAYAKELAEKAEKFARELQGR